MVLTDRAVHEDLTQVPSCDPKRSPTNVRYPEYKTEVIHRRSWRNREAVELATLEWVHWFNHRRLLTSNGDVPPAELEAEYYASS